jgi:hypothetical protein
LDFWQEICIRNSVKFGVNLEHITSLTEVRILRICWYLVIAGFFRGIQAGG